MGKKHKLKKVKWIKSMYDRFRTTSIWMAAKQQKLDYNELEEIVPDISDQYTTSRLDNDYIKFKVRVQHAFQISLVKIHNPMSFFHITDLGDSCGNHLTYTKKLFEVRNTTSLNIDNIAIDKIKSKGLEAYEMTANDFSTMKNYTDLVLLFETLEHFEDPISFLRNCKKSLSCPMIITVPYLRRSRLGFHHFKDNDFWKTAPENLHIFELSPYDWKLLFRYTGWKVVYEKIYYQYPRYIPFVSGFLRRYWECFDFEGFYGVIIK